MTWLDWSDAIAAGVCGVPDETLLRAAELFIASRLVITAGNGGSHALASHAAQALMKPDYKAGKAVGAVCLSDAVPTLTAHVNDGGWQSALVETARPLIGEATAVLIFSSSGKSPNVVALARLARERACEIVALTGFDGEPLRSLATISIHVDSRDYEVIEPVHCALLHRLQYHVRESRR